MHLANYTCNIYLFLYLARNVETDAAEMIPNVFKSWIILKYHLANLEEKMIDTVHTLNKLCIFNKN